MGWLADYAGHRLARFLTKRIRRNSQVATVGPAALAAALRPADVLLVEGDTRVSVAIKYLTQSTWSHAALYVGDALGPVPSWQLPNVLIEADLAEGVRARPLAAYDRMHTRICRAVGLSDTDRRRVVEYAVARLGHHYDLKNVVDLARYLLPIPPVPTRLRRRMLALGSGDPTRAICSTLIAQAFQSVRYPILPEVTREWSDDPAAAYSYREIYHIRHYSLFAPRDFDISPYFEVVKPLPEGFDYRAIDWGAPEKGRAPDEAERVAPDPPGRAPA
ncbi:MAG: lipo-like protein [Burkholderiales bacterium]|nr:lipo-like protein [Burkholderiales bacterium]